MALKVKKTSVNRYRGYVYDDNGKAVIQTATAYASAEDAEAAILLGVALMQRDGDLPEEPRVARAKAILNGAS